MESISFDRAADFYDQTRGLPPQASQQITETLVNVLPHDAKVLEVGVGTGRIALPLLAHQLDLTGIDLSRRMMDRLRTKLPSGARIPTLAQADATRLPFANDVFDVILAVHVYHLIAGWREAIRESLRVRKPGGMLLYGSGWRPPDSIPSQIRERFSQIVKTRFPQKTQPGVHDFERIRDALLESGAKMDEWSAAVWTSKIRLSDFIGALENRVYSSTWSLPPEVLVDSIAELRLWIEDNFGPLEQEIQVPRKFVIQRFTWD
ncbi:MAG: class I SAM-dependent methyltransferase [Anaerolineales bacterium]|jgi:ubiquinone/menaquinone biosynthesis C-methylase UbiE